MLPVSAWKHSRDVQMQQTWLLHTVHCSVKKCIQHLIIKPGKMRGDELRKKKKITTDDKRFRRALSCLFWLLLLNSRCFWKILTVFVLFLLLCLITDYHCHLLSSICYCANDEMNLFKQHLKRWQKPQLLQWLSPLISNHFSNLNQRCFLLPCFFPLKIIKWALRTSPKLSKQASSGEQEEGKKREGAAQLLETKEKGQVSVFWGKN